MKLGSLFGKPKTLAGESKKHVPEKTMVVTFTDGSQEVIKPGEPNPLAGVFKNPPQIPKHDPNKPFSITWPKARTQGMKDYQAITTEQELIDYLKRCEETGLGGFDYETAPDDQHRDEQYAALDPWKSDICTASLSAAPDEARVIFISHKKGVRKSFEPGLPRDEARKLFMDTLEKHFFHNPEILKIAVNIGFEAKHSLRHAKYIQMPVADPLVAWVRCLQLVAPEQIPDPKKPTSGKGLKPMTKQIFGVEMTDFIALLQKHAAKAFDELDADSTDALVYSAEDSDYAVQHYLYWLEVMKQIPGYEKWLHDIEMPFGRVIGLMEYWGMAWDDNLAQVKAEEAQLMQERAAEEIKLIIKNAIGLDVNPGKTGKTKAVKDAIFKSMKLPVARVSSKTTEPSLDEEALLDMIFMLENNLVDIDEEKYLTVNLPPDWEEIDPDLPPAPREEWLGDPEEKAKAQAAYAARYKRAMSLSREERGAIRIAKRPPHPYKEAGIALLEQLKKIQTYTTLLGSHIEGRRKYINVVTGRIHAEYTPWTETARLNSKHPNGQNVPRTDNDEFGIRNFYTPRPGKVLFMIDFSGFELRLMAWRSSDQVMIEIFRTGGDIHRKTASEATGKPEELVEKKERQDAKPVNFGVSYGATEHAVQKTFKTDYGMRKSLDYCLHLLNAVKRAYPGIPKFQREIALEAREKGWVSTIYGYIRLLPGITSSKNFLRQRAERQAANTPIQGSAADVMKRAQNAVYDEIGRGAYLRHGSTDMIAQIHDEIIFEMDDDPVIVEAAYKWIKAEMEKPPLPEFPVPIEAEASCAYAWGKKISADKWLGERKGV